MNRDLITKTEEFLLRTFDGSEYLTANPQAKSYRLEHTYRVANIGRRIARAEGFDETEAVIACLLHDIAYCEEMDENGWREHGRRSAQIARSFLDDLGLPPERVSDICFGIAIHVDDEADFFGARTPFALTVGDADNIDRFDAYRIHETLCRDGFLQKSSEEKREYLTKRLPRLAEIREMEMATKSAETIWRERLSFYIEFYEKLLSQLEQSVGIK